jgi:NAD(P)-dependent dehydrogenase (short-subunit alcohol dehydrogenase family)
VPQRPTATPDQSSAGRDAVDEKLQEEAAAAAEFKGKPPTKLGKVRRTSLPPDQAQVDAALDLVEREMGAPSVLIHNAVGGAWGTFTEIDPAVLNRNFQVNTMGLLYLARRVAPSMVTAGKGAIIVTGNTSAQRGRANFAGFAPTKAAQRILAEAMARDLGPKGVHVAYIVIDAVIDVPWARERYKQKPDDFFIRPAAIADELFHVAHQDRSAWSFNVEVRPFGENW